MRILHVGKFYSPIEGGIESINRFVVNSLSGNIQRVISFNNNKETTEDEIDFVPIIRASSYGIFASQPFSLKYYSELKRNIRVFHPDIIHFHYPNPLGALYLLLLIKSDCKLVVHWHSDVVAQSFLHKFIKPLEQKLLKRANVIIATSPNYRDKSDNLRRFKNKVTVIPCSIDEDKFKINESDYLKIDEIKEKYNKPIVFFVGRHVEYKGLKYLLEAEKLVNSDCVFLIAGKGPLTESLKREFSSSRIYWLGKLSDEDMKIYYNASSIIAFPSISRNEAFGVVLAESMYCGCVPITFTIPGSGVNWVSLNGITGIEVPNKDTNAYANAIDLLLNNQELLHTFGIESKTRVKNLFTKNVVTTKVQPSAIAGRR